MSVTEEVGVAVQTEGAYRCGARPTNRARPNQWIVAGKQPSTEQVGVEVPIHLEPTVREGSKFKNGSITIGFGGLSLSGGVPSALINIASHDGSFELILAPRPGVVMKATGGSTYQGNFFLELDSHWMNRLEFREFTVSRMTMGALEVGTNVTDRQVLIQAVSRVEFQKSLE